MQCDVCQTEEAKVFLTQVVEGKLQKVNLCHGCADDKGVTDPTGFALTDMLSGMGEETVVEKPAVAEDAELTCRTCGFTQTDFKKTGRFGCSSCYEVFDDGLDSLLEAMHKHTKHRGKYPAAFEVLGRAAADSDELNELKLSLDQSISAEDYEEAARLRDAISKFEAGATEASSPAEDS